MNELVGYAEQVSAKKRHLFHRRFFPSKLGGKPAWLVPENFPTECDLSCDACGKGLGFILQIYAPVDEEPSAFHRSISIFSCSSCGDQFKAFRAQLPFDNIFYPKQAADPKRDFSVEDEIIATNCCGSCGLPKHDGACTHQMPEMIISVEAAEVEESEHDEAADLEKELAAMEKYATDDAGEDFDMVDDNPTCLQDYLAGTSDEKFNRFSAFNEMNPNHILYYNRGGSPLFLCEHGSDYKTPSCGNCGKLKSFEFQLCPSLIPLMKNENADFGIVAIFTCHCSVSGYATECVIVQKEPERWWNTSESRRRE